MGYSIYIADDEKNIRDLIKSFLESDGYRVWAFETGDALMGAFQAAPADLVILDIMMPGTDGLTICQQLRAKTDVPIIMLTAKDSEYDYVQGITIGSDDYLTKPFRPTTLLMRVRSLLRRTKEEEPEQPKIFDCGALHLDLETREVKVNGSEVLLTYKEYELLKLLMTNAGIVTTRELILDRVWGIDFEGESRTLDMHIKTLRQKLKEEGSLIKTVRNVGYIMNGEKA